MQQINLRQQMRETNGTDLKLSFSEWQSIVSEMKTSGWTPPGETSRRVNNPILPIRVAEEPAAPQAEKNRSKRRRTARTHMRPADAEKLLNGGGMWVEEAAQYMGVKVNSARNLVYRGQLRAAVVSRPNGYPGLRLLTSDVEAYRAELERRASAA